MTDFFRDYEARVLKLSIIMVLFLCAVNVQAEVYKCTKESGKVEYRQFSCEKGTVKKELLFAKASKEDSSSVSEQTDEFYYPGAKLKTKDVGNGYMDYFEYKTSDDFSKVKEFFSSAIENGNCESRSDNQFNCKYQNVAKYTSVEVSIIKESDRIDIMLVKNIE